MKQKEADECEENKKRKTGNFFTGDGLCAGIFHDDSLFPGRGVQSVQADSGTVKYAVEGGNLSFNKSTGYITGADKSVTKAEIPEKIDGVAVKGLKQWVFYEVHGLTDVSLPEGLTDIEKGAFYGCDALESIVIPEGVTEISEMQFYKCTALKKVSLPPVWR